MSKRASTSTSRLVAGFLLAHLGMAYAASPGDISGRWETTGAESIVEIAPCGTNWCGRIVWLKEPNDPSGRPWTDTENPERRLRARPLLGLRILTDLRRSGPAVWEQGRIYDPESGKTYSCQARLDAGGRLEFRGYVLSPIFGRTEIWKRTERQASAP